MKTLLALTVLLVSTSSTFGFCSNENVKRFYGRFQCTQKNDRDANTPKKFTLSIFPADNAAGGKNLVLHKNYTSPGKYTYSKVLDLEDKTAALKSSENQIFSINRALAQSELQKIDKVGVWKYAQSKNEVKCFKGLLSSGDDITIKINSSYNGLMTLKRNSTTSKIITKRENTLTMGEGDKTLIIGEHWYSKINGQDDNRKYPMAECTRI